MGRGRNVVKTDQKTYFRRHEMPSKKSFRRVFLVENLQRLIDSFIKEGYADICIDPYLPDKRKAYSKDGVILWSESYAITGVRDGSRENIGYINNARLLQSGMPSSRS